MKIIKPILAILFSFQSAYALASYQGSSYVTMYNYRSPYGVDWSSPSSLTTSSIKNTLAYMVGLTKNKRRIGHVSLKASCAGPKKVGFHTGMTSVDSRGETIKLLLKDSAMGVLFHRFKGKLDNANELEKEIQQGRKRGEINSITYLIDDEKCQQLVEHHEKWLETKAYLNYGLIETPSEYTGAGCSAYAMSYINLIGVAPEEHQSRWKSFVMISNNLIGTHNREPYTSEKEDFKIPENADGGASVFQLLLSGDSWAKAGEATTRLDYWSPDMMFAWTAEAAESYTRGVANQSPVFPVKVEKTGKTHNVIFDTRNDLISRK